jgi:hypothetical protein
MVFKTSLPFSEISCFGTIVIKYSSELYLSFIFEKDIYTEATYYNIYRTAAGIIPGKIVYMFMIVC